MGGIPSRAGGRPATEQCGEPYQQLGLRRVELLARLLEAEPGGAIDLRKLLHPPRSRRPLDRERVAGDRVGVDVARGGVGGDDLAALLAHLAELDELGAGRQRAAELLFELAQRARARIVAVLVLALRDRPRAGVLLGPERSAGMHEQDL